MDLDDQERIEKRFTCPACNKPIDLSMAGTSSGSQAKSSPKEPGATDSNQKSEKAKNEVYRCSECGAMINYGDPTCANCGEKLEYDEPPMAAPDSTRPGQGNQVGAVAQAPPGESEAKRYLRHLRLFVKEKQDFYMTKWKVMDNSSGIGSVVTWNWGAFFGSVWWLGFRKMYLFAFMLLCIWQALTIALYALGISGAITLSLQIITWVSIGLWGNYIYRKHADRKLAEIKIKYPDLRTQEVQIVKAGGQSALGAIGVCAIGAMMTYAVGLLLSSGITDSSFSPRYRSTDNQYQGTDNSGASAQSTFNTFNKDALGNGNAPVAIKKIESLDPNDTWQNSNPTSAASLTKSPYSAIGKLWRLRGQVYKVEAMSPSLHLSGQWSEILLLANNPNSPLGSTTIDFIFNGDAQTIDSDAPLSIAGYFVGMYESENAMGGKVECIMMVGNAFRR